MRYCNDCLKWHDLKHPCVELKHLFLYGVPDYTTEDATQTDPVDEQHYDGRVVAEGKTSRRKS
jgi:hypothetical protein